MQQVMVLAVICMTLGGCSTFEQTDNEEVLSTSMKYESPSAASEVSSDRPPSLPASKEFRETIHRSRLFPKLHGIDKAMTTVTLQFKQVPMPVFANVLAHLSGLNIAVAKNAQSRLITLYLDDVSLHEALRTVAYIYQFRIDFRDGVVFLHSQPAAAKKSQGTSLWHPEYTELFHPAHSTPEEIKTILEPLFGSDLNKPKFSIDPRTRALIVKGSRENIELVDALLKRLDTPVRQVLIEAFVVEASEDFERSFGTRFRLDRKDSNGLRLAGVIGERAAENSGQSGADEQNLAVDLSIPAPALGLGLLLDSSRLKLELTALEAEGKSRIVSNPRIFTLDKQEAVIFQGEEVPYLTTSDGGTQTEFKQAGLRLAVTPVIIKDNQLQLSITVNKDTVDTRTPNPPITRREVSTRLKVADGAVVVIGGIYLKARVDTSRRVPLLGGLPLVGGLFRQTVKDRDAKQLLIFIAPKIVG